MSTTKTLAKGTAWGLFAASALKFLAWFYWVILARLVSQEEIGVYASVLSLMSIIILFSDLGLGSGSVGRYVPTYYGRGYYNHIKKVLKISLTIGLISSLLFMALIYLSADYFSEFYHTERVVPVFRIMVFYILAYNMFTIAASFLNGRKLIKLLSYSSNIQGLLKLALTVGFVVLVGATAENIALGFVLSYVVASFFAWFWAIKEYRRLPSSTEPVDGFALAAEMIPFGLTVIVLSSMYLINSQFDSVMLGHLLPENINMKMVGIYALIASFATITNIFANSIGTIFHPLINELWAQKNTEEMEKASSNYIRWIGLLTTPVMVMIAVFSYELLTSFYGAVYGEGATAFILYSLGLTVYSFSYPIQNTLSGMRRLDLTIKTVGIGLIVNIILNLILIPQHGINGAALASMTSFTVMTASFLKLRKQTFLKIPEDIHKPVIAGIATFIVLSALKHFIGLNTFLNLEFTSIDAAGDIIKKMVKAAFIGLLALLTAATYLFFLILLKAFTKEDVDILTGGMRRMHAPKKIIELISRLLLRE